MNKRQKQIDYTAIGKRVFDLRSARGYSQMELAELLGVERRQIGRIENGSSLLKTEVIILMAKAFGVSTDYILNGIKGR